MPTPETARADDDEWDILSGVGYTALVVAAWRAIDAAGPRPLARDDYARHFVTACADPHLTSLLANPPTSVDGGAFPRLYGVQTRFFDEFFCSAADAGIRQAVILAAGLDSRAYRLAWPAGATVFELDLPKILEFKAHVLAGRGAKPSGQRREVAADLRQDWSVPLRAAGFQPDEPAAWSVEGLLPYLTGAAQDLLFARLDQLSAPGSRVAVGALGSLCNADAFAALVAAHPDLNASGGIDFSALTYDDPDRSDPADWLTQRGWQVQFVGTTVELQARYGRSALDVDNRIDRVLRSRYVLAAR